MDDVDRLRRRLAALDEAARSHPWDRQRPWRVATHVRWDGELPAIDGHDLSARHLAVALREVADHPDDLRGGALRVITGRGKHSAVAGGVLSDVVHEVLGPAATTHGWWLRPSGPGAWLLVVDPAAAPAAATGRLGWGFWLLAAGFAAAAGLAAGHALGWW